MKKRKAMQIANVWNELHAGSTKQTKTVAEVVKLVKDWHVEIRPTGINNGNAFHYIEELAAIKATFRASVFVMQSVCVKGYEGTEVLIAYIC